MVHGRRVVPDLPRLRLRRPPFSSFNTSTDVNAPWNGHDTRVLIVALKVHAFLGLTIGALVVGVASGITVISVMGLAMTLLLSLVI